MIEAFKGIYLQCPDCNQLFPYRKVVTGKYWWPMKEKLCPNKDCGGAHELNVWNWYRAKNNKFIEVTVGDPIDKEVFKITRWRK